MICVVGRELCLFTTIDASKAPKRQQKDFATLAVRRAAPFGDSEFDLAWSADGTAAVWYWSRARVRALLGDESSQRIRFVAEAIFADGPHDDEAVLITLGNGLEGRIWRQGHLLASKWWAQTPTLVQWQDFLRSNGDGHAHAATLPPPVSAVALPEQAWNRRATAVDSLQLPGLDQYLPKAALAAGLLALALIGGQLGAITRAQIDIWRAQSAASSLDAPLKRILDAREATDNASNEISSLLSLYPLRPTTSLMAEVTRLLPGNSWQVKKWSQPTADRLELTLIAPDANPEQIVSTWEQSSMFTAVTTELGRDNEVTIKASIKPASDMPEAAP